MTGVRAPKPPSSADSHRVRLLLRPCQSRAGVSRWTHKQMNLPCERGPEGRYDFHSEVEKDRAAFTKFNTLAHPPADNAPLAPLRDEVLLIDPCCGHLSVGAEVDLGTKGRHKFIDKVYAPSDLWVPAGSRDRPQTPPVRPSGVTCDLSDHKGWNSRINSEAALRASLGGWTSAERVKPSEPEIRSKCSVKFFSFFPDRDASKKETCSSVPSQWIDKAVQRYIYSSVAQRGYEDVAWDTKLPQRLKPPATTLEKMADPVNQHFTLQRYHSRPEPWQAIGAHWNRHQLRAKNEVRKPITLGVIGSANMDNVDSIEPDFTPLTMQRTTLPPYTPTAHRPTIPGYTGKALYEGLYYPGISLPTLPCSAPGTSQNQRSPPAHGRTAPLSRMVTTVPPRNPFLHPKPPMFPY